MTDAAAPEGTIDPAGLRVERLDGGRVARIVLDRPARGNSLTWALLEGLERLVRDLPASGVRAAILTGAGERAFCTGYDIDALQGEIASVLEAAPGTDPLDPARHPLERAIAALVESPVPIVAAIRGAASGAGMEIACACDLRVLGRGARFLLPPARLGIVYSATGMARVAALLGAGLAREMLLLAEPLDAARADAHGLATRLVLDDDVAPTALALARRLAENAPLSLAGTKRILDAHLLPPRLPESERAEIARLREAAFRSADFREGVAAFLEKRPPRFEGK